MMKVILFDFFGVLCEPIYRFVILRHIPGEAGAAQVARLDALDSGEVTEKEFVKEIHTLSGLSEDEIWKEVNAPPKMNKELFDFIKNELRGKYRVGLLTNIPKTMLDRLLPDSSNLFDPVLISSELRLVKPDPRIFQAAIERSRVEPDEILFVDDKEKNVVAAQNAGMQALVYKDIASFRVEIAKYL